MSPTLAAAVEALRQGRIAADEARARIEAWPAYQPGELADKAAALDAVAAVEVERLRAALRERREKD